MRYVCRFIAVALVCAAVAGCGKVDPDAIITEKTVKAATRLFDKSETEKIDELGGNSYLVGKTVNSVKKNLDQDLLDMKKDSLIEEVRLQRSENIKKAARQTVKPADIQSNFAKDAGEINVEINELNEYRKYLSALDNVDRQVNPLGFLTADTVAVFCDTPENAYELVSVKDNAKTYTQELNKKASTNECRKLEVAKNRKTGSRYEIREQTRIEKTMVYRTGLGWIAAPEVVSVSTDEELDSIREERKKQAESLLQPPAQFYSIFRPLLNISPNNPTRIALAKKAIGLIAQENNVSWEQASMSFIQQQKRYSKAELDCYQEKNCTTVEGQARIMAGYILADDPKEAVNDKILPCEVLAISGCKKASDFKRSKKTDSKDESTGQRTAELASESQTK